VKPLQFQLENSALPICGYVFHRYPNPSVHPLSHVTWR
jgi:hypothetical protein